MGSRRTVAFNWESKESGGLLGQCIFGEGKSCSAIGVVLNGNNHHQEKGKGHQEFKGKGKGRAYEDQEVHWVRVPERDNKRAYDARSNGRGEERGSRTRGPHRDSHRRYLEERSGSHRGEFSRGGSSRLTARERSPLQGGAKDVPEEGEFERKSHTITAGEVHLRVSLPNENVAGDDTDRPKVFSGMETMDSRLEQTSELGGTGDVTVGDVPMDLDDNKIDLVGNVRSGSEEEDFENLTDGEADDIVNGATDALDDDAAAIQVGTTCKTGLVEREEAKKKGTRKALFKQTGLAVGISNKKFVQAVLSPRKRGNAKSGTRLGDGMKQATDKGTSNPKAGSSKP
ncbi:unnamed protein product [Eruca vesicaria subsp. sativa]|uniref:Uncharacterized protein n=1 Tax=Eruca vesicaria subsp. sativa TaxID=29727 RepID=A0ABC8K052_ERUVS|nr:unnamed protein product [Eruca vesicaria subsp. sativa]